MIRRRAWQASALFQGKAMLNPVRPLVIVPTYNERDNLASLIPAILAADHRLELLIVDDASPDGTADEILRLKHGAAVDRLHLECRPKKLGLGSAYLHGFRWGLAKGHDFLIQMDADWSHDPADLPRMLQLAEACDFVVGSRYISGGGTRNWSLRRKLLSRFGSMYAGAILHSGFADFTGGFNGWAGRVLRKIGLDSFQSDGYSFQLELKYRANKMGFSHIEFPIIFTERSAGESKMSPSIALEACWRVWQFRFARRNR